MRTLTTVCKPGSVVELDGGLQATIISVMLKSDGYVQYEVAWWSGNERKCEWLEACEVTAQSIASEMFVGFNGAEVVE